MKLPNGYGSVNKLSGKRRKPYIVRKTTGWEYDEEHDKMVQKYQIIGYATTKKEGLEMLAKYNAKPFDIDGSKLTFDEVYQMYLKWKYKGDENARPYQNDRASYIHCEKLKDRLMVELRREDLQAVIDECERKTSSKRQIASLIRQMFKFAIMEDICDKDYSQFITVVGNDEERGEPFSIEAIRAIWEIRDDFAARIALMMIFSGLRIKELWTVEYDKEDHVIKGGLKTNASRNRIAPIHDMMVEYWNSFDSNRMTVNYYRTNYFYPMLASIGYLYENDKKHTPHDCRHTFSWLADRYRIDETCKHLLMGHSLSGDTEQTVYRHRTMEELRTEINRIECPPS